MGGKGGYLLLLWVHGSGLLLLEEGLSLLCVAHHRHHLDGRSLSRAQTHIDRRPSRHAGHGRASLGAVGGYRRAGAGGAVLLSGGSMTMRRYPNWSPRAVSATGSRDI